jgi:hypothetical protein
MTKVIILPEEDLDTFYQRTMQYLHAKYHNYPSSLSRPQTKKIANNSIPATALGNKNSIFRNNLRFG